MLYFFSSVSSWGVAFILPWIVYLAMGFMQLLYFSRKSSGGGVALVSYLRRSVRRCALLAAASSVNPQIVFDEMLFGLKGSSSMSTL
jgi:hypothetical protein